MGLLLLLSNLFFGGDVHALGSRSFGERHEAGKRLAAVGWLAYPSLLAGRRSEMPEVAARCDDLVERLERPFVVLAEVEGAARGIVPLPQTASDQFLQAVCRRVNALGGWHMADSWVYVHALPYRDGTRRGECEYVVRTAAARRALPAVVGNAAIPR